MKHHLETAKIIANTDFWDELFGFVGKGIKDVESLKAYMRTWRRKTEQPS